MKFGDTKLDGAEGAILAHSVRLADGAFKKGLILTADDIAKLRGAGYQSVVAARLEPGDLGENDAAAHIAAACRGEDVAAGAPFTGRCNLTAARDGVLVLDHARIDRLNRVDESVTVSTLRPYTAVRAGQMVATVKIITFGVSEKTAEACAVIAREAPDLIRVAAYRPTRVALIQTRLPGLKPSVAAKTVATSRARIEALGATFHSEVICDHTEAAVAEALAAAKAAGCEIVLVLGASAIVDRRDIVPAAIQNAGGTVEHFGMPVDPGQLMLLARLGHMRVLGLPGSARSPRLLGFDWVLQRLVAGIEVTGDDLMAMGVGGLLKEIPTRPMPREELAPVTQDIPEIAALVLCAGQSRRMGPVNKLLVEIDGQPMVARTLDAVLASRAHPVVAVLGHEADEVRAAIGDRTVSFVHNPDFADGLAGSLKRGIAALPPNIKGAVICLGDMPDVAPGHIDALIEAFDPGEGRGICVPTHNGKRGNPVLWDRRYFEEMTEVAGDVGARHLIGAHPDDLFEVEMPDGGVLLDLDTPEALERYPTQ